MASCDKKNWKTRIIKGDKLKKMGIRTNLSKKDIVALQTWWKGYCCLTEVVEEGKL